MIDICYRLRNCKLTDEDQEEAAEEIELLMTEIERLRSLLWKYGSHLKSCKANRPVWSWVEPEKCDCGYAEFADASKED